MSSSLRGQGGGRDDPRSPSADVDLNGRGANRLFGVPCGLADALLHVIAVPWQATASYRRGTRHGPAAIYQASTQVDLHDLCFGNVCRSGIAWIDGEEKVGALHDSVEDDALAVIEADGAHTEVLRAKAARVDAAAEEVHRWVRGHAARAFERGCVPAVVGGDHSCPHGLIVESARRHPGLGVLHIDAHADLRAAYLGFRYSHASIFYNVLAECPEIEKLVGVGWRDVGGEEVDRWVSQQERIRPFLERELAEKAMAGTPFAEVAREIIASLPPQVHISIDIDGLDPALCPHTGTPVPGGLSWREVEWLLKVVSQERHIVSFDLCEVSPGPLGLTDEDTWDAIVGARLLHKLCGAAVFSRRSRTVPKLTSG